MNPAPDAMLIARFYCNVEAMDKYGWAPLSWAAESGHKAIFKLLVEKGANVDAKALFEGRTPLSFAAENGHEAIVKLLVEKGANI